MDYESSVSGGGSLWRRLSLEASDASSPDASSLLMLPLTRRMLDTVSRLTLAVRRRTLALLPTALALLYSYGSRSAVEREREGHLG